MALNGYQTSLDVNTNTLPAFFTAADSQTIDDIKGINMKFQEVMSKMGQIDRRITQMSQRDTKILSGIETVSYKNYLF